jgi:hypothetical protein
MMREIFYNNNEAYVIIKKIAIYNLTEKDGSVKSDMLNAWKDWLGADKVLKNQTHFLFCETIVEPQWEDVKI